MKKNRSIRHALKTALVIPMAVMLAFSQFIYFSAVADGRRGNLNYISNQGSLADNAFDILPLGAVQAQGWLQQELLLEKTGLIGGMPSYPAYSDNSAWLGGTGEDWEDGPYYVRGLVALAYTLNDSDLKATAKKWIDWSINSQKSNGFFGPSGQTDWWPKMPMLMAIGDYYDATVREGNPDARVIPFMTKYFQYEANTLPGQPLASWAAARGGDNMAMVYWLYNRIYDSANPNASKWLLDLATLLKNQTTDWTGIYTNTTVREHVVNASEGLKMPALYYQQSRSDTDKNAFENGIFNQSIDHGRFDGLPNSDEGPEDNKSTRGTETCGIVESLLSTQIGMSILGDTSIGDRLEMQAYNSLPAAYAPDLKGYTYFSPQNQVMATTGYHEYDTDHGDDSAYGAPSGFDCCFANNGMGWSKFVQSMWMATGDNGLAAVAYGPNKVNAKVADGKNAVFTQTTNYPFDETITLDYSGDTASFPLELRIPDWCDSPVIAVNGTAVTGAVKDQFCTINRTWTAGDKVTIQFPMKITTSTWYNDSVAVQRGPLMYSLKIDGEWSTYTDNSTREEKVSAAGGLLNRELVPTSRWNYGLIVDESDPESSFTVVKKPMTDQPFSEGGAPIELQAKGQILPNWQLDGNIPADQPFGYTPYDASMVENIELIPYGSAKLRITDFPRIGTPSNTITRSDVSSSKNASNTAVQELKNVVVPSATEYMMKVNYEGTGALSLVLNGKTIQNLSFAQSSGTLAVNNLKSLISDANFQFKDGHYNNVRFVGNDNVKIKSIEIVPNGSIAAPTVNSVSSTSDSFTVNTNLTREIAAYSILYGTASGHYTNTASGFNGSSATITGLAAGTTYYYKVVAVVNGTEVSASEKQVTLPSASSGSFTPDPNAPAVSFSDDFGSAATDANWTKYGTVGNINVTDGKLAFTADANVKAVVNGGDAWTDYVVESDISVNDVNTNNCGIMLRATNAGSGPDAYNGYFVGIGHVGLSNGYNGTGVMIGYSDGGWHDLCPVTDITITPNHTYHLKVVAFQKYFAVYLDGSLITTFQDSRYTAGTAGLRSYNEGFTADNFAVRNVTVSDLSVFASGTFADDFANAANTAAAWTAFGTTGKISVAGDKYSFGSDTNVKSVVNAGTGWQDYVAQATVNLTGGVTSNAGIIFRTTNATTGSDGYHGYYFGIGNAGVTVGYADGSWHQITAVNYPINANTDYTLKAVVSGDKIGLYVNNVLVYKMRNALFTSGTVGLRAYNQAFTADDVQVRPVTEADLADIGNLDDPFDITGKAAFETIQITYPKFAGATSFKLDYGTASGVYTDSIYDIRFNPYKSSSPFTADKTALSGLTGNTTYYVRLTALNGSTEIGTSKEIAVAVPKTALLAPSNLTGSAPASKNGRDGKITGVTAGMEYRAHGQGSYTACTGTEITGLAAGVYDVRYAAKNGSDASAALSVTVPEAAVTHTITVTAGGNGSVSPSGNVSVADGQTKTFTITPDAGYEIDAVTWNGQSVTVNGGSYTTPAVTADAALAVSFKAQETPTTSTGSGTTPSDETSASTTTTTTLPVPSTTGVPSTETSTTGTTQKTTAPNTSDKGNLIYWVALLASAASILGLKLAKNHVRRHS